MKRIGLITGGIVGIVGSANAVVYIGDPSIDTYKQKTDQTFYDMYQNKESALGGQVQGNPQAKEFFNSIPTGNHIAEGKYLDRVKQGTLSGGQVPAGTQVWIKVFGRDYRLVATENGVQLYDRWGRLVRSVEAWQIDHRRWHYIPHHYRCGKSTCTEYTERRTTAVKGILVPSTGTLYEYVIDIKETRPRGKPWAWSPPQPLAVKDVRQKRINLAEAIMRGGVVINMDRQLIEHYSTPPVQQEVVRPTSHHHHHWYDFLPGFGSD